VVSVSCDSSTATSTAALLTVTCNTPPPPALRLTGQWRKGQRRRFSVTGGGSSPTYQWQKDNAGNNSFSNIGGATSSSYTTPATTVIGDNGTHFKCVISVACDSSSVTSSAGTLTVVVPSYQTKQSGNWNDPRHLVGIGGQRRELEQCDRDADERGRSHHGIGHARSDGQQPGFRWTRWW